MIITHPHITTITDNSSPTEVGADDWNASHFINAPVGMSVVSPAANFESIIVKKLSANDSDVSIRDGMVTTIFNSPGGGWTTAGMTIASISLTSVNPNLYVYGRIRVTMAARSNLAIASGLRRDTGHIQVSSGKLYTSNNASFGYEYDGATAYSPNVIFTQVFPYSTIYISISPYSTSTFTEGTILLQVTLPRGNSAAGERYILNLY